MHITNNSRRVKKSPYIKGYTLLEITLVIGLTVGLSALAVYGLGAATATARASRAEAALRLIETARLSYLSDNPQIALANVAATNLTSYIPGGYAAAESIVNDNGYSIISITTPRIRYGTLPDFPNNYDIKGFAR
jgi:type II secretory pathway pseudopilin PulG